MKKEKLTFYILIDELAHCQFFSISSLIQFGEEGAEIAHALLKKGLQKNIIHDVLKKVPWRAHQHS